MKEVIIVGGGPGERATPFFSPLPGTGAARKPETAAADRLKSNINTCLRRLLVLK